MIDSLFSSTSAWNVSLVLLLSKATIILVAAIGITRAMQRASAGARHLVWLVTLGTLLLVPALTAWGPLRLSILPPSPAEQTSDVALGTPNPVPREIARSAPVIDGSTNAAASSTTTPAAVSTFDRLQSYVAGMSVISILLAVWLTVVIGIAASLAWASLTVNRIVRHARPLDTEDWLTPLWEVADRMGLDEVPRLLRSEDSKMPFACGITKPTIVLPADSDNWTLDRRRAVLLHELAHVRRHDLLGHTLGRLVCALYWFHPLVWTAAKQLRNESERACDDLALSCGTRATDYAEHLLEIVTSVRRDSTPSVALAMARRKEFEGRMLAILDPELMRSSPSRRQSAVLIGTLVLISVTVGAASPVRRESPQASVVAEKQAPASPATIASDTSRDERKSTAVQVQVAADTHHSTSNLVSPQTSSSISTGTSGDGYVANATADVVRLGMQVGMNAAARALASKEVSDALANASAITGAALTDIVKNGVVKQGKSDERPALLAKVLRSDSSASLRRIAAWGLHEYADASVASDALAQAVRRDADVKVREMAAWSLGHGDNGNSSVIEALGDALKSDANESVRATAAWSLGNIGDRSATDALVVGLSDASASVRSRATWALGNVEPRQAPSALVAKLKDSDARVRNLAAWALYQIEDPATIPALDAALKAEQDKDVQLSFIRALAAMGDKSVDVLKGLLESSDPRVRTMAVKALAGGSAAGPWPWPWPEPRPFP